LGAQCVTEFPNVSQTPPKPPLPSVIAEWARSRQETVRVAVDQYHGRAVIDVRTWFDYGSGPRPGKAGITLSIKHLPMLVQALAEAERQAVAAGLLEGAVQ
jgi:hypothetical protein